MLSRSQQVLAGLCLAVTCLSSTMAGEKPSAVIRDYGRYKIDVIGEPKTSDASGIVRVDINWRTVKHIETTKVIPCRIGERWGFRARLRNLPQDRPFKYRCEVHHPPIKQPDGRTLTKSVEKRIFRAGRSPLSWKFWLFLKGLEYELVPGKWTMKMFIDEKEIVSMTFTIKEEAGDATD